MDKLRALQYFVAAAEEGSFSAAARRFEVSIPAVTKLVAALERELGAKLVDRSTRGLKLTSRGEAYRDACVPLLAHLHRAEQAATGRSQEERTLVIGAPALLTRTLLVPALPRYKERFPHVCVDLRIVENLTVTDAHAKGLDVLLALGWPRALDMVPRPLAQSRLVVCASPDYWRQHGRPGRPSDLQRYNAILVRSPEGTLIDLWSHQKGQQVEEVAMRGWLTCERRDDVLQAVLLGQGVSRFADLSVWQYVRDGLLQPVLLDWDSSDSPPFSALVRPDARSDEPTRELVEFVSRLLGEVEAQCTKAIGPRSSPQRPIWYARQGRASSSAR